MWKSCVSCYWLGTLRKPQVVLCCHGDSLSYICSAVTGEKSSLAYSTLKGEEEVGGEHAGDDTAMLGLETQYLIKWLGRSHLHNTWETSKWFCHMCVVCSCGHRPPQRRHRAG